MEAAEGGDLDAEGSPKKDGGAPEPVVRGDFRTSVFWAPTVRTDAEGKARLDGVKYGDSLTRWRLSARAVDAATRVGSATATVRTKLDVSARLATPRFLRATDAARISLVLRNLTGQAVDAVWEATGAAWKKDGSERIDAGGFRSVLLDHEAASVGTSVLVAQVRSGAGSDAERREIPVLPQGIEKVRGSTAWLSGAGGELVVEVPKDAEPGTVSARVSVEPAVAQALVAALPYLADYPYGCTEQTMSRFVPVLAAVEVLRTLGVPPRGRAAEAEKMVGAGIARLRALQHDDGGFGWWPDDATDASMTAMVVRGLNLAVRQFPEEAEARAIRDRAAARLAALVEQGQVRDAPTLASACLALAFADALEPAVLLRALDTDAAYAASPLTRALFLRAARRRVLPARVTADLQAALLASAIRKDGLAHWSTRGSGEGDVSPTRWQEDDVEATAEALIALAEGVESPVLAEGVRWLLSVREGGDRWRSTRDTAAAVRALASYVQKTGDLGAGRSVKVSVNGRALDVVATTRENLLEGSTVLPVPADLLVPGARLVFAAEIDRGQASLAVSLRWNETGPAIQASDAGFRVTRRWWRLDPQPGPDHVVWTRTPVTETVPAGTLIECEVTVETPKEREYAMVVDPHAAGFEPEREVAMDVPGRAPAAEAETQGYDDRTVFFLSRVPAGTTVLRHLVRATHQGRFTALPAQAGLMYFPDVRGNSGGEVLEIGPEAGPTGTTPPEGGR